MKGDYVLDEVRSEFLKKVSEKLKECDDIEQVIDNIDYRELCTDVIDKMSSESVQYFENTMEQMVRDDREKVGVFLKELEYKWGKAFDTSEALYILVKEAGEDYSNFVNNLDENIVNNKKNLYYALREILGRACQEYDEIVCLLRNGFADGAMSRWRSLYELCIIAYFIAENGEETAKSFISSAISNDKYDWAKAADCFKEQKWPVSFAHILKRSSFNDEKWRNIYNTANKIVHASPQGTFDRLGRGSANKDSILVGRSNYGFKLPAEAAAISLCVVAETFLRLFPNGKSALAISYINKWVDKITEYYILCEKN